MSKRDVLLAIYKFSELKSFANNALNFDKESIYRASDTQVSVKAFWPLVFFSNLCAVTYLVDIIL